MIDNDTLAQKAENGKNPQPLNIKIFTAEDFLQPTEKTPPVNYKFYAVSFFPTMQMQTTRILHSAPTNPSMLGKRPDPEAEKNTPSSKIPSGRRNAKEQGAMSLATICNTPTTPSRPRKEEEQGNMSLTTICNSPKF